MKAATFIHAAVTLLAMGMIMAGAAVLVGSIVLTTSLTADWGDWVPHVRLRVQGSGLALLVAGVVARVVLPGRRELAASEGPGLGPSGTVMAILVIVALAATAQIPTLLEWAGESQRALALITGGTKDPQGWWMVPTTIAAAILGTAATIAFIFTVMPAACYAVSPSSAARTLRVLVVLQAGLVIGSVLALSSIRELYTRAVEPMMATARPGELTAFTDGVARQAHYATTLLWRFAWMLAGSAGALLAWSMGRR